MDQNVKEIFEKVKATASIAYAAAGKAAEAAGKKAGEMVESTKLNLQVFDLNTEIEILYKEIGKLVYKTHIGDDVDAEEVDKQISAIDEKYAKINELRQKLAELKHTMQCPNCGKEVEKNDTYCKSCAYKLN